MFSVKTVWTRFYGQVRLGNLTLKDSANRTMVGWNNTVLSGTVSVADADSEITWSSLTELGRKTGGSIASLDFLEADLALSLSDADNITQNYTSDSGSTPRNTTTLQSFGKTFQYVPWAYSSNDTVFWTGILWDSHDSSDDEYNQSEKEDLVFVTEINSDSLGAYGSCDYEVKVPEKLQEYKGTTGGVYFYVELM